MEVLKVDMEPAEGMVVPKESMETAEAMTAVALEVVVVAEAAGDTAMLEAAEGMAMREVVALAVPDTTLTRDDLDSADSAPALVQNMIRLSDY